MRILVAGAGIAGSCTAAGLRRDGHQVTVTDPYPSGAASRCAFAVTRSAWWSGEHRLTLRRSLSWYAQHSHTLASSALVYDPRRGQVKIQADYYLINPTSPLLTPDLSARLEWWVQQDRNVRVSLDGREDVYDALVIAAGPESAPLAGNGPPLVSYGGIFAARGHRTDPGGPLSVFRRTDRLSYTAAVSGGETRIGASRCATPVQARRTAEGIRDRLLSEGVVCGDVGEWVYRAGVRHATAEPVHGRVHRRVWMLAGLGRSGYAFAPAFALDIVSEIGSL